MKYGICFLLFSLCILSGLANGKKFIYESDTILFENCETTDSNETDVTSFHSLLSLADLQANSNYHSSLTKVGFRYLLILHVLVHLDKFSPPPEAFGQF